MIERKNAFTSICENVLNKGQAMISMKDIAGLCGVSEAAVSKALRGKAGVGEKLRERIQSIARQYNYIPNALVQGIQNGCTRTIGIISGNEYEDAFAGRISRGVDKALFAAGFSALIVHLRADSSADREVKLIRNFAERRVDGLLVVGARPDSPALLNELRRFYGPVTLVDQPAPGDEFDFAGSDDIPGARAAAEHLIALGCRGIAFCGVLGVSTGRNRLEGFRAAMAAHGLPVRADWIWNVDAACPYDIARESLSREDRPDAVLCFNDFCALDVMAAAYDLGLKVPEQLSVTGFADLPLSTQTRPALTTVSQDAEEMGRVAAELLLRRIREKGAGKSSPPEKILLPTKLIVRGSTATYESEKSSYPSSFSIISAGQ